MKFYIKRLVNFCFIAKDITRSIVIFLLFILYSCKDSPVNPENGSKFTAGPILFISDKSETSQLYSMNEDGSNVQQLTNDPDFPVYDAKWSPDGNKIAVVSLIGSESTYPAYRNAIFIMDADGSNKFQLTKQWFDIDDLNIGKLEYGGAVKPVWSPDSKQIAFTRLMVPETMSNYDIFNINADGTDESRITRSLSLGETVTDWISPGAALLGWTVDWSGIDTSPFTKSIMYDIQGNVIRIWGKTGMAYHNPIAAPDGNKIALAIDFNPASYHQDSVFVLNIADELKNNITIGIYKFYETVSWSPDAKEVLVAASAGDVDKSGKSKNRILILDTNGSNSKDITPFENNFVQPTSWRRSKTGK